MSAASQADALPAASALRAASSAASASLRPICCGVLDVLRRRLMMQLRAERLRKGRAALRAGWQSADLLLDGGDLRRAGAAMGDAGAGEQCRGRGSEKEAARWQRRRATRVTIGPKLLHCGLPDHRICQFKFQVPERFRVLVDSPRQFGHTVGISEFTACLSLRDRTKASLPRKCAFFRQLDPFDFIFTSRRHNPVHDQKRDRGSAAPTRRTAAVRLPAGPWLISSKCTTAVSGGITTRRKRRSPRRFAVRGKPSSNGPTSSTSSAAARLERRAAARRLDLSPATRP